MTFPKWRTLALLLALVVASNAVRLAAPADGTPSPAQQVVDVAEIGGDGEVRIAYLDLGGDDGTPLLLLHGTPVAGAAMDRMARALQGRHRVIVPDLPGFGGSTLRIADYSFVAHAAYLRALLDELDLASVHVVAYSQGGGPALELARRHPDAVSSLTLLSSIGVQELELFGDYQLNHALYQAQLWGLQALAWLVPHFGYFDDALLGIGYARNLSDSDQRPLRAALQAVEAPTLILHGRSDAMVPVAAAQEHARLVPHSVLDVREGGHGLPFTRPGPVAERIDRFLARVEAGEAPRRADATAQRLSAAQAPFDWSRAPGPEGFSLFLILLLLAVATYFSEDLACIVAGLLVARGVVDFVPASLACFGGILTGDLLLMLLGRVLGRHTLERAPLRWLVPAEQLRRSRQWFHHRGPAVILATRFVPGTRMPTYVVAGMLGTPLRRLILFFVIAAALWTPLLVAAAWLVGGSVMSLLESYQRYSVPLALGVIAGMLLLFKLAIPALSHRGRRRLLSSWRRLTRWEFWPPWVFYPPLLLYILALGIRHRGPTLFTAANPAMPAGGFVGESKSDILDGLRDSASFVARHTLLCPGAQAVRLNHVRSFMAEHGLDYPVVLKPDVGERGRDVLIARDESAVREHLGAHPGELIVQEFAPGHEFGVFYYRFPGAERGAILAITDKRPTTVEGDGERTLEQLILDDERAVCSAATFMRRHAQRLYQVPAPGEEVALVEVGTHCLGCEFRDGGWVLTDALADRIDAISRGYRGFYFGRYDIRTPSLEDFRRGYGFKIVELNGVSSEATSIYDPGNSLWQAYRVLMRQWSLAFCIGAANRARGAPVLSVAGFFRLLLSAARRSAAPPASSAAGDSIATPAEGGR